MPATISDVAYAAPVAFLVGIVIGLFLASFFGIRIVKRNGRKE